MNFEELKKKVLERGITEDITPYYKEAIEDLKERGADTNMLETYATAQVHGNYTS